MDRISEGKVYTAEEPLLIESMSAYITLDENDNTEGVLAMYAGESWMPMVMADHERIVQMRPVAEDIARRLRTKVMLVRFSNREVLSDDILEGK
jgi:hypothetical protein